MVVAGGGGSSRYSDVSQGRSQGETKGEVILKGHWVP